MVPDVLGTEPPGRRPGSATRRRWIAGGLAVAVALTAFVLASRSEPAPRVRVAPPPSPSPAATPPEPTWLPGEQVAALGGTVRWAYALVFSCRPAGCEHRLLRRSQLVDEPVWSELTNLPAVPVPGGLPADLVTAGESTVAVVDRSRARAWVSDDGGSRFREVAVRPGPAVATVPDGLTAELGRCTGCQGQVGVFDPATGLRRRLATQPPLDPPPTAFSDAGLSMWAASSTENRITIARSEDRGRTWRTSSLPQTTPLRGTLHLATSGGGDVRFLVAESLDRRFPAQVWISLGAATTWRAVRSDPDIRAVDGVVIASDHLVVASGGRLFAEREGQIQAVRPPRGQALPPVDVLGVGSGMVLARVSRGSLAAVVSSDPEVEWRVETLPT